MKYKLTPSPKLPSILITDDILERDINMHLLIAKV